MLTSARVLRRRGPLREDEDGSISPVDDACRLRGRCARALCGRQGSGRRGDDLLCHQRRSRQGRRSRRARGRGSDLPDPWPRPPAPAARPGRPTSRRRPQAPPRPSMPATASAAAPGRTRRASSSPRTSPNCTARNNLTKQTALTEKGAGRQRPRRHPEHARHPDRLAAGRDRLPGRRRPDLRQLDEERRRASAMLGHSDRTGLDESAAAKSWNSSHGSRRLHAGRPEEHRRRRAASTASRRIEASPQPPWATGEKRPTSRCRSPG